MQKALILVYFQNDYFEGGTMTLNGITKALKNANLLIKKAIGKFILYNTFLQEKGQHFLCQIQKEYESWLLIGK
ncbi:hypothetical protein [Sulfurimonas sp. CS5]|uniref:Uncharacterized protein n=1 Tax=uncultured microorganism TaxID=358574 RepID=L8B1A4_9ZZZZ|nr:conserved hypothetical protein [uncultured microorganism]